MTIVTLFFLHSIMLPLYLTKLHLQQCLEMVCNITADTDILSVASRYFEMPALTKIITLVYVLKFLFFFFHFAFVWFAVLEPGSVLCVLGTSLLLSCISSPCDNRKHEQHPQYESLQGMPHSNNYPSRGKEQYFRILIIVYGRFPYVSVWGSCSLLIKRTFGDVF